MSEANGRPLLEVTGEQLDQLARLLAAYMRHVPDWDLYTYQYTAKESQIPLTMQFAKFLGANPQRKALIISQATSFTVYVSTQPAASGTTGFFIPSQSLPVVFTWRDYADLPAQDWYGVGQGGLAQLTVVEILRLPLQKDEPP